MEKSREVAFFQSPQRPHLLLHAERELVLFSGIGAGCIIFSNMTIAGCLTGAALWFAILAILVRMAKADPMLSGVYLRHIRYQAYYPAGSYIGAQAPKLPMDWGKL